MHSTLLTLGLDSLKSMGLKMSICVQFTNAMYVNFEKAGPSAHKGIPTDKSRSTEIFLCSP